jgi:flavin-dependent dehydrogenase
MAQKTWKWDGHTWTLEGTYDTKPAAKAAAKALRADGWKAEIEEIEDSWRKMKYWAKKSNWAVFRTLV